MTELEALAKDCIENHTHRLVDKPTEQDIYLREESIFIQGYRQSEKKIEELEKENAKLKRENREIKTCTNCDEYVVGRCCNYSNGVCHHWKLSEKYRNDDELTKAKEIIRQFLNDYPVITKELLDKLEQFIKEIEK